MENKTLDSEHLGIRIIISISLFMVAVVIGYNAFYCKPANQISNPISKTISSSKIATDFSKDINLKKENSNVKININTCLESDLEKISGVGPKIAFRIIEYRKSHGGFSKLEEIKNVKGIGEKIFEKIKENICV